MQVPASRNLTILIVDDNLLNLTLLKTILVKEGYRVIMASNGARAKEMAAKERPDLILLDIMMPGENGFQVIKHLKQHSGTTSIPVIFLTGVSEIDSKLAGFELGAVDYITKPFHAQEILARVRLHLKLSLATNSLVVDQAQKLKQIQEAQHALLTTPEQLPAARFGIHYLALHEAGGDFYEVLPIADNIFGYFVADFSGHDIKTSYLTASVKALLRQNCTPIYQPLESIKMINDVLIEILPGGKYLTACYARLNRDTKQMAIINAGHPPVVYAPADGEPRLIDLKGDILGVFRDVCFGAQVLKVAAGDRFFLFSDGLLESAAQRRVWTRQVHRVLDACAGVREAPIEKAPEMVFRHLFQGDSIQEDDVVVLGLEV